MITITEKSMHFSDLNILNDLASARYFVNGFEFEIREADEIDFIAALTMQIDEDPNLKIRRYCLFYLPWYGDLSFDDLRWGRISVRTAFDNRPDFLDQVYIYDMDEKNRIIHSWCLFEKNIPYQYVNNLPAIPQKAEVMYER